MANPFEKSARFFGNAYGKLEAATEAESFQERPGFLNNRYVADSDQASLYGAVPPQMGAYGEDKGPYEDIESVKEDLLQRAKSGKQSSNGSFVVRAEGGTNPAVQS